MQATETRDLLDFEFGVDLDTLVLQQYSLFKLARVLTGPYNTEIVDVLPRMTYEESECLPTGCVQACCKVLWSVLRGTRSRRSICENWLLHM